MSGSHTRPGPVDPGAVPGRRRFLGRLAFLLGALWTLVLTVPGLALMLTPVTRRKSDARRWIGVDLPADLPQGRPVRRDFSIDVEDGWMQRKSSGYVYAVHDGSDWVVFSPVCTHLGCKVGWSDSRQRFLCPCHGGQYDLSGQVVAGPPPAPLVRLPVRMTGDQVEVEVSAIV